MGFDPKCRVIEYVSSTDGTSMGTSCMTALEACCMGVVSSCHALGTRKAFKVYFGAIEVILDGTIAHNITSDDVSRLRH